MHPAVRQLLSLYCVSQWQKAVQNGSEVVADCWFLQCFTLCMASFGYLKNSGVLLGNILIFVVVADRISVRAPERLFLFLCSFTLFSNSSFYCFTAVIGFFSYFLRPLVFYEPRPTVISQMQPRLGKMQAYIWVFLFFLIVNHTLD